MNLNPAFHAKNDQNSVQIKGHSIRSQSVGRSHDLRTNPPNNGDLESTVFSRRENLQNPHSNKTKVNQSNIYSFDRDEIASTLGNNASFSAAYKPAERRSEHNNSINVAYSSGNVNLETVGDEEPIFPTIQQKIASNNRNKPVPYRNTRQAQQVRSVAVHNINIEGIVNDRRSLVQTPQNNQMLRNYKPRGNWTPIARTRRGKEISVGDSLQLTGKFSGNRGDLSAYNFHPSTEKAGAGPQDQVLKQLAMYFTQNTGNMELGFNGGLRLFEDQLQAKGSSNKTTRSSSCVRSSNSQIVGVEDRSANALKRTIMQNKTSFTVNKNQNVKSKYANIPVKKPANTSIVSPRTATVHHVSDVYRKNTTRRPSRSQQPSIDNKPVDIEENKRVKVSNLLGRGNKGKFIPQLDDTGSVYDGGPKVRTPKLKHDNPLMNSNTLIRRLYRVKDGSARSLNSSARSERDMSNDNDTKAKSMTFENEPSADRGQNGEEKKVAESGHSSRRLSSAGKGNIFYLNLNTPIQAKHARDRGNLSVTHTSSFSSRNNSYRMEGLSKGWKESKKMVEEGKRKDASFIQFSENGSPVLPRARGIPFDMAGKKAIFGTSKTPGPGKYYIRAPSRGAAFSFGQEKK